MMMERISEFSEQSITDIGDQIDQIYTCIDDAEEGSSAIADFERDLLQLEIVCLMIAKAEEIQDLLDANESKDAEALMNSTRAYLNIWESLSILSLSPRSTNSLRDNIASVDEKLADDADDITCRIRQLGLSNMHEVNTDVSCSRMADIITTTTPIPIIFSASVI